MSAARARVAHGGVAITAVAAVPTTVAAAAVPATEAKERGGGVPAAVQVMRVDAGRMLEHGGESAWGSGGAA